MSQKEVGMNGSPRNGGPAREPDDRSPTPAQAASAPVEDADAAQDRPLVARPISRRAFLGSAASASALLYLRPNRLFTMAFPKAVSRFADEGGSNPISIANPLPPIDLGPVPDLVISAERDDDLLLLDFSFYDFMVDTTQTPLAIVPTSADNTVVVQFAPQAIGEANYPWQPEAAPNQDVFQLVVDPPPILSDLSGPSRLCFNFAYDAGGGSQSIPLKTMTVADLLDWSGWALVVPPVAQVGALASDSGFPVPAEPTDLETAIEFPYALFLAPTVYTGGLEISGSFSTGFSGRTAPLTSPAGVTDLWSTALVGQSTNLLVVQGGVPAPAYVPQVAAVWAVDYIGAVAGPPPASDTPENFILYQEPTT
jgi:hypothetical protein